MKRLTGLLLLAALSCPLHAATADADAPGETGTPTTEPAPDADQADKKSANKLKKKSRSKSAEQDIFRPSEEISEDFAVPFPVDI